MKLISLGQRVASRPPPPAATSVSSVPEAENTHVYGVSHYYVLGGRNKCFEIDGLQPLTPIIQAPSAVVRQYLRCLPKGGQVEQKGGKELESHRWS